MFDFVGWDGDALFDGRVEDFDGVVEGAQTFFGHSGGGFVDGVGERVVGGGEPGEYCCVSSFCVEFQHTVVFDDDRHSFPVAVELEHLEDLEFVFFVEFLDDG